MYILRNNNLGGMLRLITILVLVATFVGCSSAVRFKRFSEPYKPATEQNKEDEPLVLNNTGGVLETVEGVASYYADKFHGRTTANGETYDMYANTAAHPTYPFGTIIRVTNMVNGLTVQLRVNDRMPYNPKRIIDLSYGAAIKLDMLTAGIQKVKIEVLEWGPK